MKDHTTFCESGQAAVFALPPAPRHKRLSKPERRILRLADAEHELDRVEAELFTAVVLADDTVRKMLQDIRRRVVVALAAVRVQRGEDKE